MCIAEPGLVMAVADEIALVSIRGVIRQVPLTVLTALNIAVAPGEFVLVHTGLAVAVLSPQEVFEQTSFLEQGAAHEEP